MTTLPIQLRIKEPAPQDQLLQSLLQLRKSRSRRQPDHGASEANDLYEKLGLDQFLGSYPELSLTPTRHANVVVEGAFYFRSISCGIELEDVYELKFVIDKSFPKQLPAVFETGKRIPPDFHRLSDGSFCLGSPLRLQLLLGRSFTFLDFVHKCVVPYLHGYSIRERGEGLPFGELKHGFNGIINDYKEIFDVESTVAANELFYLASRPRSKANREPCPCGSGLRVGKCHNRILNELRKSVGRLWFRDQFGWMGISPPRRNRLKRKKQVGR